jgi:hypothetical protein
VSAFAAGCEHCGADLEAHARRERLTAVPSRPGRAKRSRGPSIALPRPAISAAAAGYLAASLFAALFIAPLGLLLAGLGGWGAQSEGRRGLLLAFMAVGAVAVLRIAAGLLEGGGAL